MTVVEFFDKDAIENIVSALMYSPENVFFIGDKSNAMKKAVEKYSSVVEKYGKKVKFSYITVERNNLNLSVEVLNNLLDEYGEITIDLTGGEDLYLVAAGIVYNSNPERVQLHRFNIHNGKLYDCDADGKVVADSKLQITIEDNMLIYGGRVIYEDEKPKTTHIWDFNEEFRTDIDVMWKICSKNAGEWNRIMNNVLADDPKEPPQTHITTTSGTAKNIPAFFSELEKYGLINDVQLSSGGALSFDCKNLQVKRCLKNAGQLLELKTTTMLLSFRETANNKNFNDILTGVTIDWDKPETKPEGKSTANKRETSINNEIDVIVMDELVPVFISCKNGEVNVDEFYKLSTVANRFGGKYAKKVLVATEPLGYKRERAAEMNIEVIDDLGALSEKDMNEFAKKFNGALKKVLN